MAKHWARQPAWRAAPALPLMEEMKLRTALASLLELKQRVECPPESQREVGRQPELASPLEQPWVWRSAPGLPSGRLWASE
jgi:hypothetical protein